MSDPSFTVAFLEHGGLQGWFHAVVFCGMIHVVTMIETKKFKALLYQGETNAVFQSMMPTIHI